MAGDVLGRAWPEPEERQDLIAFVERMLKLDTRTQADILARLGLDRKRLARWQEKGDEPSIPYRPKSLDGTLIQEEKSMICNYYLQHPGDGYRRCTYMMQDEKLIGVSPATVYKVLKEGEVLRQAHNLPGRKGFDQPSAPHHHWHTDFTSIKAGDRYYHLISVIDGYSRAVLSFGIYAQRPHSRPSSSCKRPASSEVGLWSRQEAGSDPETWNTKMTQTVAQAVNFH